MLDESEKHQIINAAIGILSKHPEGMKGQELRHSIQAQLPKLQKQVYWTLLDYSRSSNAEIYQSSRFSYRLTRFKNSDSMHVPPQPMAEKIEESAFYEPFATWLMERDECNKAKAVGGNMLKDKWGTPDVMGIRKPFEGDIVKFPVEVVSAEIKVSGEGLITAFGQACSYKLFSHRSYIVVPRSAPLDDIDRLESLCLIFGIGLILFDKTNPQDPKFEFLTRAAKHDPDMFYVNEKIRPLGKALLG